MININITKRTSQAINATITIDESAIKAQVQARRTECDLTTLAHVISDSDTQQAMQLICNKSGRLLSTMSSVELEQVLQVAPEPADYLALLHYKQLSQISPAWLRTDFEHLRKLSKFDPRGYCVYTAFIIFDPALKSATLQDRLDTMWAKKRLFDNLGAIDDFLLAEANELARRYLSITSSALGFKNFATCDSFTRQFLTLNKLADSNAHFALYIQALKDAIKAIIAKHLKTKALAKNKNKSLKLITAATLKEISIKQKAETRFQRQRKLKKQTVLDSLFLDLNEVFTNLSADQLRARKRKPVPASVPVIKKRANSGFNLFAPTPTQAIDEIKNELEEIAETELDTSTMLSALNQLDVETLSLDELDDADLFTDQNFDNEDF